MKVPPSMSVSKVNTSILDNLYYDYEDYYSACAEGGKKKKKKPHDSLINSLLYNIV